MSRVETQDDDDDMPTRRNSDNREAVSTDFWRDKTPGAKHLAMCKPRGGSRAVAHLISSKAGRVYRADITRLPMLLDFLTFISQRLPEKQFVLDLECVHVFSFGISCIISSIRVPKSTCLLDEKSHTQASPSPDDMRSQTLRSFIVFKDSRRAEALLTLHDCDLQYEVRALLV